MDVQIAKTTQNLTTAADMRVTTQMLMQPSANWEGYLTPAPLSIAIMGELVFISSTTDFSINKNPPKDGFKYIKYPDSFRASLMQICNSGWHAFNLAHKNMDQIRIHTFTVPDYMKAVVKILFQGNDEIVETLLPNQLENIRSISDECVVLAESVEKKYEYVINIIQELLEACINANHVYGEELENVRMKLEENKLKEQTSKELNERSKKAMEAMSKELEETQEQYKKAMDSIPSGWEMIGMDLVEGMTSVLKVFSSGAAFCKGLIKNPFGSEINLFDKGEDVDMIAEMKICSRSGQILQLASSFSQFINNNGINWKEIYDQKNKCTKTTWQRDQFERIHQEVEDLPRSKLKETALFLCQRGINICEQLAMYAPGQKCDRKMANKLIKETKKLCDDALKFDCKSKKKSGSPALNPKPPMMFKTEENSGSPSASQRATENAYFRIEQSREQLKQTREAYEKAVQNMEQNQRELTEILVEMQNCKIKEIDFDTTIKMLVKGMDAMGRVKEQWEKMVRFFQMVANIVKTSLGTTLNNFVKTSEDTKKLSYNSKLFAKDMLYNQAFEASNIASLVHMISGTYCEVSNKYLMDRVSSLGKLMAMDKESPEFMQERLKLQESCQEAQGGIMHLVLRNKKEFERKTDARMAQIEGELKAILPSAPPSETQRIKEIVQTGFGEEEENYY
ncbi:hypothetical protein FQA47_020347 [Oryzias melastigma]|uniref:Uncharacterized LOC112142084 n=1 Tax=Oryzias melastigma TaxID=30732 RepID=A0A3B3BR33_ORYME|nr:uncharacterized protein LOC112142084 [Oryzias melastigma]XP_024121105.1 uncharacterized protein LOC112142084 [Oryzias melastigma]XP_036070888.1 uncharacterized protein LOC112142084 [Oryzias melastigma]KAF6726461.1 hypothetical protein FQA47_020347 [Oryzias melastigma]